MEEKICDRLYCHDGALDVIKGTLVKPLPSSDDAMEKDLERHKDECDQMKYTRRLSKLIEHLMLGMH